MSASAGAISILTENPELLAAVAIIARLIRAWQASLTWPEYRAAHRFKRGVLPILDRVAPGQILLVSRKGGRDDAEFLRTVNADATTVAQGLRRAGGTPHLLNSLKRRPDTHGDPLTAAHLVWGHADGTQTEAYLFDNADGTTDVYVHVETSTDDPVGHLTDPQTDGDAKGVVAAALAETEALA